MAHRLHTADYILFIGAILMSLAIGLWVGLKGKMSRTKEDYFVGNRKMKCLPVTISLLVTYQSSIMMLGIPAEVYIYGPSILISGLGFFAGDLLAAFITAPLFRPLRLISAFQYLHLRFSSRFLRFVCVILSTTSYLFYMGIVLFGPAVALEAVTELSRWIVILSLIISAVIYTSVGGIISVVWTDVFQGIIMLAGLLSVISKGILDTGGLRRVWEIASEGHRVQVFDFNPDPTIRHTVWTLFLPTIARSFQSTFNQSTVQRVCATRTDREAKWIQLGTACMTMLTFCMVVLEGQIVYAYFASQSSPEPLSCGLLSNPNQIVPYAVLVMFKNFPGMPGLFLAALFSASLSTLSSGLSSLSILVMEDAVTPFFPHLSESKTIVLAKISVILLGVLSFMVTILVSFMSGSLTQIASSLIYSTGGPLVGVFMLGCFFPTSISKGALLGAFCGSLIACTFSIGQNFAPGVKKTHWLPLGNSSLCNATHEDVSRPFQSVNMTYAVNATDDSTCHNFNIFDLSYNFTALMGVSITVIVGIITSYAIGRNRPGDVDPKYLLAITDSLLVWLPPSARCCLKNLGPQFNQNWDGKEQNEPQENTNTSWNDLSDRQSLAECVEENDKNAVYPQQPVNFVF